MRSARSSVAALAVAAVVPLAACNADMIGAAAVVGDHRISVEELHQQVEDMVDNIESAGAPVQDVGQIQSGVLDRRVRGLLLRSQAEEAGVEVTPAQVDQQYQQQVEQQMQQMGGQGGQQDFDALLAQNGFDEESFKRALHDDLLAQALIQQSGGDAQALTEQLTQRAADMGVQVNPRFGTWEGIQLAPSTGSISEPAEGGGGQTGGPGGQQPQPQQPQQQPQQQPPQQPQQPPESSPGG